jgi:hypothetical protein
MVSSVAAAVNLMEFLQAGPEQRIFGYPPLDAIRQKEVRPDCAAVHGDIHRISG